jgi:hypothetical protein
MERGRKLWRSVYGRHEEVLLNRLGEAHPDLPGVVLAGSYGLVLAGEEGERVGTSLVAVACLRARRGAGKQLVSHVYGLSGAAGEGKEGERWLGTDEGSEWVVRSVDRLVECFETGGSVE